MTVPVGLFANLNALMSVALYGEQVPVIHRGRIVGTRIRHNTRVTLAALRSFDREEERGERRNEVAGRRNFRNRSTCKS